MADAQDLLNEDLSWPEGGEVLVGSNDEDWRLNAQLDVFGGRGWVSRDGFRRAAEVLNEHLAAGNTADLDLLAGPIIFSWRHHVELALKDTLRILQRLADESCEDVDSQVLTSHKLGPLWSELERLLVATDLVGDDTEDIAAAGEILDQLKDLDPRSFTFRYATDTAGNPVEVPAELDVARFHDTMVKLARFLQGVSEQADVHLGDKQEMEREFTPSWSDVM